MLTAYVLECRKVLLMLVNKIKEIPNSVYSLSYIMSLGSFALGEVDKELQSDADHLLSSQQYLNFS